MLAKEIDRKKTERQRESGVRVRERKKREKDILRNM